ncbi:hypothetical protein GQ457_07G017230 [Hibiscus cannabinus]
MANLSIGSGDDDGVQIVLDDSDSPPSFEYCFVGSFLTSSIINFPSMKSTMAQVWHPPGGISITDLGEGRFLFRLYHILGVDQIANGGPWFFNTHLLRAAKTQEKIDSWERSVPLCPSQVQVRTPEPKLTLFCFLCGILGHGESFCPLRFGEGGMNLTPGWDASLRAPSRRSTPTPCKWLIEEGMNRPKFPAPNHVKNISREVISPSPNPLFKGQSSCQTSNQPQLEEVNHKHNLVKQHMQVMVPVGHVIHMVSDENSLPQIQTSVAPVGRPNYVSNIAFDTEMSLLEEDNPIANSDSAKRPRVQHPTLAVSTRLDSSGDKVSKGLDRWFRKIKRDRKLSVKELQERISFSGQQQLSDSVLGDLIDSKLELNLQLDKEEIYWEQRARANWLRNGDRNTNFFHRYASQRRRCKRIDGLVTEDGAFHDNMDEVRNIAVSYFSKLFTTSGTSDPITILDGISCSIDHTMNQTLMAAFTRDDIFVALNSMGLLKASGADGLGAVFYQRFWGIIGHDIVDYCIGVLHGDFPVADINKTHIVHCPSKVKILNWRMVRNYVPTLHKLFIKLVATDPTCLRCRANIEDSLHVVRDCFFAREVWHQLGFNFPLSQLHDTLADW